MFDVVRLYSWLLYAQCFLMFQTHKNYISATSKKHVQIMKCGKPCTGVWRNHSQLPYRQTRSVGGVRNISSSSCVVVAGGGHEGVARALVAFAGAAAPFSSSSDGERAAPQSVEESHITDVTDDDDTIERDKTV